MSDELCSACELGEHVWCVRDITDNMTIPVPCGCTDPIHEGVRRDRMGE